MEVWNEARERCFDRVLGNGYNFILDVLNNYYGNDIEFEIRIADSNTHCSENYWNVYNQYLVEDTALRYDIIMTYENPNLRIYDTRFREYKFGNIKQEKTLISRFSTVKEIVDPLTDQKTTEAINDEVIPLVAKVSRERYIPTIRSQKPVSYAKTYRQTFKIDCDVVSARTRQFLKNWNVDKTIRIIANTEDDIRFVKTNITDINKPIFYDILDLEFEYDEAADPKELEESLLALIEFIYIAHPQKRKYFQSVSFEYQLYNIRTKDKMKLFIQQPDIKQRSDAIVKYALPPASKCRTLIYENDDNYIAIDENIDFSHFQKFDTCYINIIKMFGEYAVDIYVSENENICHLPYAERLKILESIGSKIWSIPPIWDDEEDKDCLYMMDDFRKMSIMPNVIEICLKIKQHTDGSSYLLYTRDDVALSSPLLNKLYIPGERNAFDKDISNREIFVNGEIVRFQCICNEDIIDLVPICKESKDKITTLQEATYRILEAYAKKNDVVIDDDTTFKPADIFIQSVIERYNKTSVHNLYVSGERSVNEYKILRLVSDFIKFDNLVYRANDKNIVNNLAFYYSDTFIPTIYQDSRLVLGYEKHISVIGNNAEINDIPGLFKKDMDFIITSFNTFQTLTSFVNAFENLQHNTCTDGTIVFNYIAKCIDIFNFIYDVSKDLTATEITKIEETSNVSRYSHRNITIDIDQCKDIKKTLKLLFSKRPKDRVTLIRSRKHINSKELTLIGEDEDKHVYRHGVCTHGNVLRRYLLKNILKDMPDNDIILYMLKLISTYFSYTLNIFYPFETDEVADGIAYNKKTTKLFGELSEYKNYTSAQIKVNI